MTSNNNDSQLQKEKAIQKKIGYRFPESKIKHVGPYGINDRSPSLQGFESSQRTNNRREKRRQELEKKKRRKKKVLIVFICIVALLLLIGGVLAAKMLFSKMPDDEIVPVATTEAPAEQNNENTAEGSESDNTAEGTEETEEETEIFDPTDIDPSYCQVINRTHPIPENYVAGSGELVSVENGKQLEKKAAEALAPMLEALRAEGMDIIVQSAYRTDNEQEFLYNRQIGRQGGDELKAATISAVPLTSEHQAGLAVDFSVDGSLTEAFGSTPQGEWLYAHCAEYGFILRYPAGKEAITGIISEPWHFRFVGSPELATSIMDSGMCMEEYYDEYLDTKDIDPYLPYLQ